MSEAFEQAIGFYERAAEELRLAAAHCDVAARHFRDRLVPRGTAHAFAAEGHVLNARGALDDAARLHASKSSLDAD